jgi:hypothetical protein
MRKLDRTKQNPPLVLRRETVRIMDDDALHQVRGGGKAASSNAPALRPNGN